ncbi:hypothetical protein JCM15124A_09630 [Prevotella falsenii]
MPYYSKVFNLYRKVLVLLSKTTFKYNNDKRFEHQHMCIVTIAFNEEKLIQKQIQLIKQHITDKGFKHIIADNSAKKQKRGLIKNVCQEEGVDYIALPRYIHRLAFHRIFWDGMSHGAALNWVFYHIINAIKPNFFTFLDHDLLPFQNYNLSETIGEKNFIGVERLRDGGWYLWPGFSIYNYEYAVQKKPDFLPIFQKGFFLDAGGGNYLKMFKEYDPKTVDFLHSKTYRIKKTQDLKSYNDIYHGDCIQIIDNAWLHIINGSNYAHINGKEQTVKEVIENIKKYTQIN